MIDILVSLFMTLLLFAGTALAFILSVMFGLLAVILVGTIILSPLIGIYMLIRG